MKILRLLIIFVLSVCLHGCWFGGGGGGNSENAPQVDLISLTGKVIDQDTGRAMACRVSILKHSDGTVLSTTSSNDQGYSFQVSTSLKGQRVRVNVVCENNGFPDITNSRVIILPNDVASLTLDDILLPTFVSATLQAEGAGTFSATDGSGLRIEGAPNNIAFMWAKAFNPGITQEAFPGEFFDSDDDALNSSAFVWIVAVDEDGNVVTDFSGSPLRVMLPIMRDQWVDLLDLQPGNGKVDIPMYSFNENTGEWMRESNASGVLMDENGVLLTETEGVSVRNGSFARGVFVNFQAEHLSWWNVDYALYRDLIPPGLPVGQTFADFGDAPGYPVIQHNRDRAGNTNAWLGYAQKGGWVSFETEQQARDTYDDGILTCGVGVALSFGVNNLTRGSTSTSNSVRRLYLNVLIDRNRDGDWADTGEWVVQNQFKDIPSVRSMDFVTSVTDWESGQWLRATVTAHELVNFTGTGVFDDGETEDYLDCARRVVVSSVGGGRPAYNRVHSSTPAALINCSNSLLGGGICSNAVENGSRITLVASDTGMNQELPATWRLACEETTQPSSRCTFNLQGDTFVSVNFPSTFRLSATASGGATLRFEGGDSNAGECAYPSYCRYESYDLPSSLAVIADLAPEYYLHRWSQYGTANATCSGSQCAFTNPVRGSGSLMADVRRATQLQVGINNGKGGVSASGINCHVPAPPSDCSEYYPPETSVTLNAQPDTGYQFSGWSGACSGGGACQVTVGETPVAVSARFDPRLYRITTTAENGVIQRSSNPSECLASAAGERNCHPYDQRLTLTAVPNEHYTFNGWSGCTGGDATVNGNTCTFTVTGERSIQANFQIITSTLTVTKTGDGSVNSTPSGIDCGSDCTETANSGTRLVLAPTPASGFRFVRWEGCPEAGSDNACIVTFGNTDISVGAVFELIPAGTALRVTPPPYGSYIRITPPGVTCDLDNQDSCLQGYAPGTSVTLELNLSQGTELVGWLKAATACGTNLTCVITVGNTDMEVNTEIRSNN